MSSGSVDQKNNYVFEVKPYGVAESAAKELCYWSTSNGDDTMLTLWNPADEPQDLGLRCSIPVATTSTRFSWGRGKRERSTCRIFCTPRFPMRMET